MTKCKCKCKWAFASIEACPHKLRHFSKRCHWQTYDHRLCFLVLCEAQCSVLWTLSSLPLCEYLGNIGRITAGHISLTWPPSTTKMKWISTVADANNSPARTVWWFHQEMVFEWRWILHKWRDRVQKMGQFLSLYFLQQNNDGGQQLCVEMLNNRFWNDRRSELYLIWFICYNGKLW